MEYGGARVVDRFDWGPYFLGPREGKYRPENNIALTDDSVFHLRFRLEGVRWDQWIKGGCSCPNRDIH